MSSRSRSASPASDAMQKYALVEWLTGSFKGTFTHNVEVEWIDDFDDSEMFRPTGHAIEWRVAPKPKSGWHVYTGRVHEVSFELDFLKRRESELSKVRRDEQLSPRRHDPSTPNSRVNTPRVNQDVSAQELLQKLANIISPATQRAGVPTTPTAQSENESEHYVKIGKSLLVPRSVYLEAQASRSPSAMTMGLIKAAFSRSKLKKSSYAGQKRTRDGVSHQKPGLKKYQATQDIQDFVRSRFKVSQSTFGLAVNACLGNKAPKKKKVEFVQEVSDNEDSDGIIDDDSA